MTSDATSIELQLLARGTNETLQHAVKGVFNRFIVYPILRCILMNPATPVPAIEEHHLTEAGRRFLAAVGTGYWLESISCQHLLSAPAGPGQVRAECGYQTADRCRLRVPYLDDSRYRPAVCPDRPMAKVQGRESVSIDGLIRSRVAAD